MADSDLYTRYVWFRARCGYALPPGRAQCALELARAERWLRDHPELTITWLDDDDADLSWMDDDERAQPHTVEGCAIVRPCETHGLDCKHSDYLSSLWGIVDADTDCRRLVAAQLASEIMAEGTLSND